MSRDKQLLEKYHEESVCELFHENSKQHRSDLQFIERIIAATVDPRMQMIMASAHKHYHGTKIISLPQEYPKAKMNFDRAILSRRSSREFGSGSLELPEVAKILQFANGITASTHTESNFKHFFRASPSGGALYPNEIYLLAFKVKSLPAGIYHYDPMENNLHVLSQKNAAKRLSNITYTEEINNASAVFALTGISLKNRIKYGERGYRFMLMEAGHIAQNILLTANSLQLSSFPIGGFIDDELNELLGVDGLDEVSLYLIAIGRRPEAGEVA